MGEYTSSWIAGGMLAFTHIVWTLLSNYADIHPFQDEFVSFLIMAIVLLCSIQSKLTAKDKRIKIAMRIVFYLIQLAALVVSLGLMVWAGYVREYACMWKSPWVGVTYFMDFVTLWILFINVLTNCVRLHFIYEIAK